MMMTITDWGKMVTVQDGTATEEPTNVTLRREQRCWCSLSLAFLNKVWIAPVLRKKKFVNPLMSSFEK
jgi:hypothetical protein